MTEPLVSICIPTYNGEAYLKACLDSCVNQIYENYEIVICDDGSKDASTRIIEEYAGMHPKIRFYRNEKNLGLVANWNRCIELSKGEWIKFVFQDDYVTKNCLQQFAQNVNPSVSLLVSARNFILPENPSADYLSYYTNEVRTLVNTNDHKDPFFSPALISRIAVQNISMNFIGEPSLTFFRKNLVNELGFFSDALKQICDLEFFLRIGSKYGLSYIPEKLCAFRIHSHSTTSTNLENKYFELHYIEPLLFSWFLLYGEHYSGFRAHLNTFQKMKLKLYFRVKCYSAYTTNVKKNYGYYLFAGHEHPFKEIFSWKKGNILVWLIAALRK